MVRYKNIDILKFIGLVCIILAHVSPPGIIFQVRNFDVILMIMISSYLFFENNKSDNNNYFKYVIKRIKRLLIPTWIFLIFFFIVKFLVSSNEISFHEIMSSFLLHNGIGYVWIIRIYLLVALFLPIMKKIYGEYDFRTIFIINIILYILYELLCNIGAFNYNIILEDIVAYIVPCILIINITYYIKKSEIKNVMIFSIINMLIFLVSGFIIYKITGSIHNTNYMKYPFRLYYLSYAFFVSSLLIILMRNKKVVKVLFNKLVEFVSKSSLWIYLWHILFVSIVTAKINDINFIIKFLLVFLLSLLITFVQNLIVKRLKNTRINKEFLKIFLG